jgi:hypothetical protein
MNISKRFPKYKSFEPKVPVWCVTPNEGRIIHRFFDTSPFSPSGRYMALFRLPYEDHLPEPGDKGQVVLVDLEAGKEVVVAESCGWESQVGANVQWGTTDFELYYNDVDTDSWTPFGVKLNPFTGEKLKLDGCIFMISPDGKWAATTCPIRASITQPGYGVIVPQHMVKINNETPEDDGLYITNTSSGECKLLISIKSILTNSTPKFNLEEFKDGEFYGFQCKWNPQGTRLLMVLRWLSKDRRTRKLHVITMKNDGTEVFVAIPSEEWGKGGHHINWSPDGEHLTMNLNIDGNGLRFVRVKYDGTGLHKILGEVTGSGHPTVHISEKYILTDAYIEDEVAFGDSTIPIRLINIENGNDQCIIRIKTEQQYGFSLRVDPHPAWDKEHRYIAFNGYVDGTRRVYIADVKNLLH